MCVGVTLWFGWGGVVSGSRLKPASGYNNIFLLFVCRKSWYSVVSLGRCSFFPSRVGLRTYQHPCKTQFVFRLISTLNAEKHTHISLNCDNRVLAARLPKTQASTESVWCLHCTVMLWQWQKLFDRHTASTSKQWSRISELVTWRIYEGCGSETRRFNTVVTNPATGHNHEPEHPPVFIRTHLALLLSR